jgi:FkbM family methyltransferase
MTDTSKAKESGAGTVAALEPSNELVDRERVIDVETDVGSLWLERDAELMTPSVLEHGAWAGELTGLMRALLRPGMTFVDAGANVGYLSVLGSKLVGPSGRVFSIEVDPRNVEILRTNLWRNGCSNARVLPVAAWEERTELNMILNAAGGAGTWVDEEYREETSVKVPAFPLDELIEPPVDYVKVDCEGHDQQVVRGAEGLIRSNPSLLFTVEFMPIHAAEEISIYRGLGLTPYEIRAFGRLAETTYERIRKQGAKDEAAVFDFALAASRPGRLTSRVGAALRGPKRLLERWRRSPSRRKT